MFVAPCEHERNRPERLTETGKGKVERFQITGRTFGSRSQIRPFAAIAEVVQIMVHIERIHSLRRVAEVLRVDRYDAANDEYELTQI